MVMSEALIDSLSFENCLIFFKLVSYILLHILSQRCFEISNSFIFMLNKANN